MRLSAGSCNIRCRLTAYPSLPPSAYTTPVLPSLLTLSLPPPLPHSVLSAFEQPIDVTMLKGSNNEAIAAGTSTFRLKASKEQGSMGVAPGAKLVVRVLWGFDSVISEGSLVWPKA